MKHVFILLSAISTTSFYCNAFGKDFSNTNTDHILYGVNVMPATGFGADYFRFNYLTLSYSFGLTGYLRISNHFGITSGLQFTNIRLSGKMVDNNFRERDISRVEFDSTVLKTKTSASSWFIDLPLLANIVLSKKVGLGLNCGFLLSYAISNKAITTLYRDVSTKDTTIYFSPGYNIVQIVPTLGLGLEHEINYRYKLKFEPMITFRGISYNFHSDSEFWSIGVNFVFMQR